MTLGAKACQIRREMRDLGLLSSGYFLTKMNSYWSVAGLQVLLLNIRLVNNKKDLSHLRFDCA